MAVAVVKRCKILGISAGVKAIRASPKDRNSISGEVGGCSKGVWTSVHAGGESYVKSILRHIGRVMFVDQNM